jgi:hypothetical protein
MSLTTMTTALLAVGDAAILLNPVTPVLALAAYAPYAWLISSKIEKDATAFNLNKGGYGWINPALLAGGIIAVAVGLLVPFAGWLVTLLIEAGILVGYWKWRDKQVPPGKQFKLSMLSKLKEKAEERKAQKNAAAANLVFLVGRGEKAKVPGKDDPLLEVHQAAERVIGEAIAARASRTQIQSLQGSVGVVDVVEVVVLVVVEVVEVVVVEVVVDVFAHPPTGGFQMKPPLPFDPATYRHSPWQTGFTTTGAGVVDGDVVVDSSITSGRSFDHVPSLCR